MTISNNMTVIAMLNGMIGGAILVLPLLALRSGYLMIAPVTIFSGIISFFSCLLCLRHLGDSKDLDEAILLHFKDYRFKMAYDLIIAVSLIVLLVLYFNLICHQWVGMFSPSPIVPIANSIALCILIYIMRSKEFGTSLLAYGIISIIAYILFLIWAFLTAPSANSLSIPSTHVEMPAVGPAYSNLAAALGQGFAIQTFFIPILKHNNDRKNYKNLVAITYLAGIIIYGFIGYVGALSNCLFRIGIMNRKTNKTPDLIEDYFVNKDWAVLAIETIYLLHLFSAFPEFMIIAIKRLFGVFGATISYQTPMTWKYMACVVVALLLCVTIYSSKLRITIIIEINGAIISFFFIYVIPISLHIKCVYFSYTATLAEIENKYCKPQLNVDNANYGYLQEGYDNKESKMEFKRYKIYPVAPPVASEADYKKEDGYLHGYYWIDRYTMYSAVCERYFSGDGHYCCYMVFLVIMVAFGIFTIVHTMMHLHS